MRWLHLAFIAFAGCSALPEEHVSDAEPAEAVVGLMRRPHKARLPRYAHTETFDPATLSLTGWWRGPYVSLATQPWQGTASLGVSGTRVCNDTAPYNPLVGTGANGIASADVSFNTDFGRRFCPETALASLYATRNAHSGWAVFKARTVPSGVPNNGPFFNGSVLSFGAGVFGIGVSTLGVEVYLHDGANIPGIVTSFSTGVWHILRWRYSNPTLEVAVNSGGWQSLTNSTPVDLTGIDIQWGRNVSAAVNGAFDGEILDVGISNTALSQTDLDNVRTYARDRYALPF